MTKYKIFKFILVILGLIFLITSVVIDQYQINTQITDEMFQSAKGLKLIYTQKEAIDARNKLNDLLGIVGILCLVIAAISENFYRNKLNSAIIKEIQQKLRS